MIREWSWPSHLLQAHDGFALGMQVRPQISCTRCLPSRLGDQTAQCLGLAEPECWRDRLGLRLPSEVVVPMLPPEAVVPMLP